MSILAADLTYAMSVGKGDAIFPVEMEATSQRRVINREVTSQP
jgi:hypothetical protein